jgi:hypothetical protein
MLNWRPFGDYSNKKRVKSAKIYNKKAGLF